MRHHVWVLHDRDRPGHYLLAVAPDQGESGAEGLDLDAEVLQWREARRKLEADNFAELCRLSFADWCARRGL